MGGGGLGLSVLLLLTFRRGLMVGLRVGAVATMIPFLSRRLRWCEMMTTSSSDISPLSTVVVVTSSRSSPGRRHRLRGRWVGRTRRPGVVEEVDPCAVVLAKEAVYRDEYPAGVLLVVWGP